MVAEDKTVAFEEGAVSGTDTKVAVETTGGGNCEAGLELFALELEN